MTEQKPRGAASAAGDVAGAQLVVDGKLTRRAAGLVLETTRTQGATLSYKSGKNEAARGMTQTSGGVPLVEPEASLTLGCGGMSWP